MIADLSTNDVRTFNTHVFLSVHVSGPANDWTELIIHCLRWSQTARNYLADDVLFKHSNRFQEYLIDCTSAEVNC
jgi:hypothetical protein